MIQKRSFLLLFFSCWCTLNNCSNDDIITGVRTPTLEIQHWLTEQNLNPKDYDFVLFKNASYLAKYLGQNYRPPLFPLELAEDEKEIEIAYYYETCAYYEIMQPISEVQKLVSDIQTKKRIPNPSRVDRCPKNDSEESLVSNNSFTDSSTSSTQTVAAIITGLIKHNQPFCLRIKNNENKT
jgi:hypothetical protein